MLTMLKQFSSSFKRDILLKNAKKLGINLITVTMNETTAVVWTEEDAINQIKLNGSVRCRNELLLSLFNVTVQEVTGACWIEKTVNINQTYSSVCRWSSVSCKN